MRRFCLSRPSIARPLCRQAFSLDSSGHSSFCTRRPSRSNASLKFLSTMHSTAPISTAKSKGAMGKMARISRIFVKVATGGTFLSRRRSRVRLPSAPLEKALEVNDFQGFCFLSTPRISPLVALLVALASHPTRANRVPFEIPLRIILHLV